MKRKKLTANQRAEFLEAHGKICWRCGLPIDPIKQKWHEGHVGAPHALGGTKTAPEHKECNMADAPNVTKMVAKANRVRAKRLGATQKKQGGFRGWRKFDGTIVWRSTD
jgi:hypothetical protein